MGRGCGEREFFVTLGVMKESTMVRRMDASELGAKGRIMTKIRDLAQEEMVSKEMVSKEMAQRELVREEKGAMGAEAKRMAMAQKRKVAKAMGTEAKAMVAKAMGAEAMGAKGYKEGKEALAQEERVAMEARVAKAEEARGAEEGVRVVMVDKGELIVEKMRKMALKDKRERDRKMALEAKVDKETVGMVERVAKKGRILARIREMAMEIKVDKETVAMGDKEEKEAKAKGMDKAKENLAKKEGEAEAEGAAEKEGKVSLAKNEGKKEGKKAKGEAMAEGVRRLMGREWALQVYWAVAVRKGCRLLLTDGRVAEVVQPGVLNHSSGPDFSFARMRVDGKVWAGDVEMHRRASDWFRHGHDGDSGYDAVILHVVCEDDGMVCKKNGEHPAQVVMRVPEVFGQVLEALCAEGEPYLRCGLAKGFLGGLQGVLRDSWIEALLTMRYSRRAEGVKALLDRLHGNWRQTAFAVLARSLGFGVNGEAMEALAASVPLSVLERHSGNLFQLEALLMGRAGLLPEKGDEAPDDYCRRLVAEYGFLGRKYGLEPLCELGWKLRRVRPANMPQRRVALLAAFCAGGFTLLDDLLGCDGGVKGVMGLLGRGVSDYWQGHYGFGRVTGGAKGALSGGLTGSSRELVCINGVVTLLYAYGLYEKREELCAMAEELLGELKAEATADTRMWREQGFEVRCAADSQALHFLYGEYCSANRCAECRWGLGLLRRLMDEPKLAQDFLAEYEKNGKHGSDGR